MGFTATAQKSGRLLLLIFAAVCVLGIAMLAKEVILELELLDSADSDNVQWTLSQAEVEFLEFKGAVDTAEAVGANANLLALRIEFDIFYSRIETLRTSSVYAALRETPEFEAALADVLNFMEQSIPIIDGSDAALTTDLPILAAMTDVIRPTVRDLGNSGLFHFAEIADDQRFSIWRTLVRLGVTTSALTVALALLARHANSIANQTRRRGQELSAAYSRLNTILETSLDAVIVADASGRIVEFNEAAERIFDRRFVEVVGRRIGEIIVPEDKREAHEAGIRRMQEDPSAPFRMVGQGRRRVDGMRANGEVFPVEVAVEMAESDGDRIMIAFLRDISHRVQSENELVEARDRALAGEKAKADFLAVMTHEIRTPLNGVLGNLALLEETRLSEQQSRYVHNMSVSGKLLMHHVDAVLDIARFESGKMQLSTEAVHLGRLVQEIVDGQSGAAHAKGNVLSWGWQSKPVSWVKADPSRMLQIILNLVGNAIKFTENGSVNIEVEQFQTASLPGVAQVEIRIVDTGVGIAPPDQSRIFEDFQTSDSAFSRTVGGTGLGLGIARRIAQAMGGEIGVESVVGEGSVFWLRVPLELTEAPETVGSESVTITGRPSHEILVVEDNEINLMVVREMLDGLGQRVTEAHNGKEGVDAAASQSFDLILMDISMPVMDGLEAARAIRAGDGPCKEAPIVALSANVLPEAKDRFLEAGMSGFLSKPLRKDELRAVIDRLDERGDAPVTVAEPSKAVSQEIASETREQLGDAVYAKLRDRFSEEAEALVIWLSQDPEDLAEMARRSHKVAGSAAVFGAIGLRDVLVRIETAAEGGDETAARSEIGRAVSLWSETRKAMQEVETA